MEAVVDPGEVILRRVARREAKIARLQAETAADLLAFEDVRAGQAAHLTDANDRALARAAIRDEASLTLVQPVATVYDRLSQARIVRDRLPKTWRAFRAGRIDAYRVGLIGAAAH